MQTALITGVTGQDGSYLAELLLEKGYEVIGMVRRSSTVTFERIEKIQNDIKNNGLQSTELDISFTSEIISIRYFNGINEIESYY